MILDKAKAFVAAGLAFGASFIATKWGLEVPVSLQTLLVDALVGLIAGLGTWAVPNAKPPGA
jgi:hypothetical protein